MAWDEEYVDRWGELFAREILVASSAQIGAHSSRWDALAATDRGRLPPTTGRLVDKAQSSLRAPAMKDEFFFDPSLPFLFGDFCGINKTLAFRSETKANVDS